MPIPKPRPFSFLITESGCFQIDSHRPGGGGYPQLRSDGISIQAHRHIWEQCFGEIPKGICVLHHCDNPACVNPEHLFLGTHFDNMRDMVEKERQAHVRGERQGNAKLTVASVREIRRRYRPYGGKDSGCALAQEFNVHPATILAAADGRNWGWVK